MALVRSTHDERRVHVDVMTGKIKRDQALEDDGPPGEGRGQEHQQTRGRAPIRHHVQNRAEARALLVVSRGVAIEGVEEAGDAVEEGARARVQGHVVERGDGQDDSDVAYGFLSHLVSSFLLLEVNRFALFPLGTVIAYRSNLAQIGRCSLQARKLLLHWALSW